MLAALAEQVGLNGRYNFFVWQKCVKIPDLKILYKRMNCTQNWSLSSAELQQQFQAVNSSSLPYWTIVFPEVNAMSQQLLEKVS